MPKQICALFSLLLLTACAGLPLAPTEWQSLFDGKTLDGWVRRGGKATYRVEDGAIVGMTKPKTPNTFLCTEKHYADFILELDFKVDPRLNSGVQIRSRSTPQYKKGRVHGYQVEIDPSERAWSAGIYDEARRGWLNNLKKNEPAQKSFKQNQWNHLRIEARGNSLKTWLNGVPAADLKDSMTASGFIGLQVHSCKSAKPLQVRWRNLRIKDLGGNDRKIQLKAQNNMGAKAPAKALVLLGKTADLTAWHHQDPKKKIRWTVSGEELRITPRTGSICTKKTFNDFHLHLEFNIDPMEKAKGQARGNSGVYIQERYEVQILDSFGCNPLATNDCGAIYKQKAAATNACRPAGTWQSYDIRFRAPRWNHQGKKIRNAFISVIHNGKLIQNCVEIKTKTGAGRPEGPTPGPIKLQDHGNIIRFRNAWIEDLGWRIKPPK